LAVSGAYVLQGQAQDYSTNLSEFSSSGQAQPLGKEIPLG